MSESIDSQKILNNLKRRIKEISRKSGVPITELYRSLTKENGFQSWNEFTKNLAANSHDPKVQKLISMVKERADYKTEKNQETEEWMRIKSNSTIDVLTFQWRLMADKDREEPLQDVAELLNVKNQLTLPEQEGQDFFLAQRLANYYQVNRTRLESKMKDIFYREVAKLFLENKEHFLREFPRKSMPSLSSQFDLNWAVTQVYKNLQCADSRNETEEILFHLLRSSPNNELMAQAPSRYPYPT